MGDWGKHWRKRWLLECMQKTLKWTNARCFQRYRYHMCHNKGSDGSPLSNKEVIIHPTHLLRPRRPEHLPVRSRLITTTSLLDDHIPVAPRTKFETAGKVGGPFWDKYRRRFLAQTRGPPKYAEMGAALLAWPNAECRHSVSKITSYVVCVRTQNSKVIR